MLGHLDPRVLPITAYTESPPPQKGVPFLSKMVYKRVGGWILPGVACLYIILLCLHQTLDKQRVRKRCIVTHTKDQPPVIIVDLQDVNLIVASEKGLKLHINFYSAIWYLF